MGYGSQGYGIHGFKTRSRQQLGTVQDPEKELSIRQAQFRGKHVRRFAGRGRKGEEQELPVVSLPEPGRTLQVQQTEEQPTGGGELLPAAEDPSEAPKSFCRIHGPTCRALPLFPPLCLPGALQPPLPPAPPGGGAARRTAATAPGFAFGPGPGPDCGESPE